jgi:hypothetical protein
MPSDLNWQTVDVDELPEHIRKGYEDAKAAYKQYMRLRQEFEDNMQAQFASTLPEGQELKFGYNFGKLSIAVGPVRVKKQAKAKMSLQNWLKDQANG